MADPMSPAAQLVQLRVRSITAGLSDYTSLDVSLDPLNDRLTISRLDEQDGKMVRRKVEVNVLLVLALARLESDHPARAPVAPTPLHVPAFGGKTFDPEKDEVRLVGVLKAVHEVMSDGQWRTLYQLRQAVAARHKIDSTEAGLSARLRDLRKPQHGGRTVLRERVPEASGLWRYRLAQKAEA